MKEINKLIVLQIKLIWNDYKRLVILIMMALKLKLNKIKKNGKNKIKFKN